MAKDGKRFEAVIDAICRSVAEEGAVERDVKLQGRSGTRQVDVLITYKRGFLESRIAIECKDHKRPLDVKEVDSFAGMLEDLHLRGYLVSASGFSKAARVRAMNAGIKLLTYRQASEADWDRLVGAGAWITIVFLSREQTALNATLGSGRLLAVPPGASVRGIAGSSGSVSADAIVDAALRLAESNRWLGSHLLEVELERDGARVDGTEEVVIALRLGFTLKAIALLRNLAFDTGHVLQTPGNDNARPDHLEIYSESFEWKADLAAGLGRELTDTDLNAIIGQGLKVLMLPTSNLMPYLRLSIRTSG